MVLKMLIKFGRTVEHVDNFNIKIEKIRKYQLQVSKLKNTITEVKMHSRGSTADKVKQREGSVKESTGQWNAPKWSSKIRNIYVYIKN